jgi:hypothetical protein
MTILPLLFAVPLAALLAQDPAPRRDFIELVGGEEDVLRGASRGFYDRLLWDDECFARTTEREIGIHQLVLAVAVRELNTIASYTCGNPCDKEQSKHEHYGHPVLAEWILPSVMMFVFMRVWFV